MLKAVFLLDARSYKKIYPPEVRARISQLVDIYAPPQTAEMVAENSTVLNECEAIFSGWGHPVFTSELLQAAPKLKIVFYGAGTIKALVTDAFWKRGVRITSAWAANAVPVVEYCLAQILLGLKTTWQQVNLCRSERTFRQLPMAGAFGSTVGLVSLGMIGRQLVKRLRTFEVNLIAYDPYVKAYPVVTMCSLEQVFQQSDVVSVHTPWLPETFGLITGAHLASMKPYSTFINTSRGAIIREQEMIAVLQDRPDLVAVIDVTYPEPPVPESPLYTLPNVILTPHLAGSMDGECRRMGQYMIAELERYLAGKPLRYELTRRKVVRMA